MKTDSRSGPRLLLVGTIVAAAVGCDQLTKYAARATLRGRGTVQVIGRFLVLRYAENQGAFLGLGADWPALLRSLVFGAFSLALVVAALLYVIRRPHMTLLQTAALSLVIGGGMGNLIDRLARAGYVTDFLNLGVGALRTGIFNAADLFLMAGVALFVFAGPRKTAPQKEGGGTP
jgi:signal peptidase II